MKKTTIKIDKNVVLKIETKEKREENSWLLTTKYSTNHANLLVIFVSHGSLASLWLQETIQSMAHKIVLLHSNNTSIPHNKLQSTIKSSKPVRGEHEIKKTLQVSKLWVRCQKCQNVRVHYHEPSMALARARPCRGYQIHVDYQVSGQMVTGQQLYCYEKKNQLSII